MYGVPEGQKLRLRPHQSKVSELNHWAWKALPVGNCWWAFRQREIMSAGTEHANLNGANGHASVTRYDEP